MTKQCQYWVCEVCGIQYTEEHNANICESSHTNIVDKIRAVSVRYAPKSAVYGNLESCAKYPQKVVLRFSNDEADLAVYEIDEVATVQYQLLSKMDVKFLGDLHQDLLKGDK